MQCNQKGGCCTEGADYISLELTEGKGTSRRAKVISIRNAASSIESSKRTSRKEVTRCVRCSGVQHAEQNVVERNPEDGR